MTAHSTSASSPSVPTPSAAAPTFASLGLAEPLLRALAAKNYQHPTPIQARAIPHLLKGRDLLGIAQTGTGKTAAFALPMLQLLTAQNVRPMPRMPRALVLAPTRELATQIADSFEAYGKHYRLRVAVVFGGVGQNPQVLALRSGVDVLVATPGRLLDLIQQRHCDLGEVEILVLDEADRMLDMGFLPDVRRVISTLPKDRQSLLFSATMPQDITSLAHQLLRDPLRVEVTPPAKTADRIAQSVHFVTKDGKRDLLVDLLQDPALQRVLVFTRTKHGADRVVKHLKRAEIHAHAIHGNKSQNARERALDDFRDGRAHVLVATDIAARGIDVPDITHVVNFDLPNIPESYVHRIGRTARAGRDGIAISFCDSEEREYLRDIEKLIKQRVPVASGAPRPAAPAKAPAFAPAPARRHADDPWSLHAAAEVEAKVAAAAGEGEDGDEAPRPEPREKHRQRPTQRTFRGAYEPTPEHERRRPARPPEKKHRGRPASPNLVDPEERRERQQQYQQQQQERRPAPHPRDAHRDAQPRRDERPHHGHGQHAPRPHRPTQHPARQGTGQGQGHGPQRRDGGGGGGHHGGRGAHRPHRPGKR